MLLQVGLRNRAVCCAFSVFGHLGRKRNRSLPLSLAPPESSRARVLIELSFGGGFLLRLLGRSRILGKERYAARCWGRSGRGSEGRRQCGWPSDGAMTGRACREGREPGRETVGVNCMFGFRTDPPSAPRKLRNDMLVSRAVVDVQR